MKFQKEKEWKLEDFNQICGKFLSEPLAKIVKEQAVLKHRRTLGRRYSGELKQFALTLYFLGPRAYSFISKLLYLPTVRTLQKITQKLVCKPGLANKAIFEALKIKVNKMLELDKHCAIVIDEMSIKSNLFYNTSSDELVGLHDIGSEKREFSFAKNALVIMARGLYSNWKQPIAYFFLKSQFGANPLRAALEECVLKLTDAGLFVETLVNDMGSNFIELSNSLGVTPDNPEFEMSDIKIIYIFDVCHLIKAVRNGLMKNKFCFDEKTTSWSYIESFFDKDSHQFYRCAPKLTTSHIYPSNFQKMKVNLAVQVLSHTVSSGMNVYMTLGGLPKEAIGTIEFIEKFNNLFDMFNSSYTGEKNIYKMVFEGNDFQIKYLNDMVELIKKLKIFNEEGRDVTSRFKFQKCWLITISGLKKLWERLSAAGFKYLKTKRINSDCLENFFGGIRQQGGNDVNPTPIQFQRAFKKLVSQNYLHSSNMNCKDDLGDLLVKVEDTSFINFEEEERPTSTQAISLPDYGYREESIPVQNAFKYVCGYLIKKALGIHRCNACELFSKECEELDISQLLTYFKAYDSNKSTYGGLRTPNEEFINYIYKLEKTFISKFDQICLKSGISNTFLSIMKDIPLSHPCHEFPRLYVLKLFIRLRMFYSLKYANAELKTGKAETAQRKIKILSHL